MRFCNPLPLTLFAITVPLALAGDGKSDKEAIQGTWVPVAAVVYGNKESKKELESTFSSGWRHVHQFHIINKSPGPPILGGGGEAEDHRRGLCVVRRAERRGYC